MQLPFPVIVFAAADSTICAISVFVSYRDKLKVEIARLAEFISYVVFVQFLYWSYRDKLKRDRHTEPKLELNHCLLLLTV